MSTMTAERSDVRRAASGGPRWHGSSVFTQVMVFAGRSLRALREPRLLIMSLIQPFIMLVLFSQVFRGIANGPGFPAGANYIDYLMPAILVTTSTQAAMGAGAGLANDLRNGVLARFRALPVRMVSVLVGRSLYDLVRNTLQLGILLVAAAALFGFAPAGGVVGTVSALALALFVGWGVSWVLIALATWLRNVEVMQMVGFVAMFPLMFASSAFVPIDGMPGWLQAVARVNPLTYAVDASRGLAFGHASLSSVAGAVVTSAVLALVGGVLAARGIRRP
ncbi:ABC-2 type transport system permease protein [Streptoalloteichus tenebrarius]|uniref:Transport permease protein n=1 Tax=Streptoalloteichus tenebrarius (strain ATCC 17920 / DSM 40477 / JCM 4838 / CBS 697.72 / NBRC 16177 / NCIMB 11028 / NRRL B-12390 / A12253. 1 / ISP 5477) TaxID=1933 RepID=A0ABT1HW85_STRSD|nr:ABC transporter permease [Streptoalloteichus tenebrarius]MCP2259747.1 ABC-2 type transport system permease protein [Streptoalloteichus tenebrarius]BFF00728.1 ABC transporter permease [Streptoalloteichus tenebrarius]